MAPTSAQQDELKSLKPENFDFLCRTVYKDSGIVLDESKGYLLESRLLPVVKSEGATSLDDLCRLIRATGGERLRDKVVEAMTTNETLFFRDVSPFEGLEKELIPKLMERAAGRRPLRFWSAACSSGQEAYSLAMMCLEMGLGPFQIEFLGTDLSDQILERAQRGRFMQLEVNRGLPAKYLVKYFTRHGMEWEIEPEVRQMVRWTKLNLALSWPDLGLFDVVLCRNVLIYFDTETKRGILARIRRHIRPEGYLILGSSETTLNIDEEFIRRQVGPAIMYENPGS